MFTSPTIDSTFAHSIIARHLNMRLSSQDTDHGNRVIAADSATGALSAIKKANGVLYRLLLNYVDLLETADHGGWTLAEDNNVRHVVGELLRGGWNFQAMER